MSGARLWLKAAGVTAVAAILPLIILGCGKKGDSANNGGPNDPNWPDRPGPKVVVSFAPLYCFAANVAGDDAVIKNVMTTTGPHDFNPTAADVKMITKAEIFFVVGLGLDEDKAEKMKEGASNDKLKIVQLGKAVPADKLCEGKCNHDHKDGKHDHGKDEHVWLSPDHAALMHVGEQGRDREFAATIIAGANAADHIQDAADEHQNADRRVSDGHRGQEVLFAGPHAALLGAIFHHHGVHERAYRHEQHSHQDRQRSVVARRGCSGAR